MEEIIYTWILTKTDGTYLGWSKAIDEPHNGDTVNMKWIEWNKPLPEMTKIDEATGLTVEIPYKYENGELKAV